MSSRPGTVSKILWHFTGGPLWDSNNNKQLKQLKPAKQGYEALLSILENQELRIGNYHEVVKVIVRNKRKYNFDKKSMETIKDYPVTIISKPVCCVADIPLQHISYHSNRYGKMAIGFHRKAIIKSSFNPVMYTLENTKLLNSIYKGFDAIEGACPWQAQSEVDQVEGLLSEKDIYESIDLSSISWALESIGDSKNQIEESYSELLAFIKTFSSNEFDSIYCEREWRSISSFKFNINDIAIIVLPRNQEGRNYYDEFLSNCVLPRHVTVACWEDLIEH